MGNLFGFIGLLLAIPVAAAAGVLVRYATNIYMREYVEGPEEGMSEQLALSLPVRAASDAKIYCCAVQCPCG